MSVAGPPAIGRACRVHRFGPPEVIVLEDVTPPAPGAGDVLVRVKAAGVGPWDAWVRSGRSALPQPLPLTLGADLAGVVVAVGPAVTSVAPGDAVFGVTNARFTGSHADYEREDITDWAGGGLAFVTRRPVDPQGPHFSPVLAPAR